MTIPTLQIVVKELKRAFTTIFISILWVINLSGLRVLNILKTLKAEILLEEILSSIIEITTIVMSKKFQESLK